MARFWFCVAGAGCFLALLVLHSRIRDSPVLREFVFQVSWRTENVLYRLDVGWPKHSEYFTGVTFCVAVDSLNGLVYIAQVWVADRGNRRIQVFDKDTGEWLGAWNNCFTEEGPSSVRFTPDWKYLIVAQLNLSRLLFVAAPPVGSIGYCSVISSIQLADQVLPHLLDISGKTGAIYVAEIGARQVQKYVPLNSYFRSFHS
uniref:NHL repeat containing 3 n=1 Tax=Rousettus aegyptiacus TaxID=9407 RepID=A0A7J8DYM4_ROUAE|nr:NHL repeat containing 3 [Rousettus aegyptiacus]